MMLLKTTSDIIYCTAMQIAYSVMFTTGNGVVATRVYRQFIMIIYDRPAQDRIRSIEHGRNGQCGEYIVAFLLRRLVNGRNREMCKVLWISWSS